MDQSSLRLHSQPTRSESRAVWLENADSGASGSQKVNVEAVKSTNRWFSEEELAEKRELYEERAGILEFDAHFTRDEAEERAWMEVYGRKP